MKAPHGAVLLTAAVLSLGLRCNDERDGPRGGANEPRRDAGGGDAGRAGADTDADAEVANADVAVADADAGPETPATARTAEAAEVLELAVRFYGAQRCGDAHNWLLTDNPTAEHCHLEDGPALAPGLDLTGGWHDAGDFIKFTRTIAWSAYVLLKAFDTFPDGFPDLDDPTYSGEPNGIPDVLDEVRAATDYLLKTHPDADTLVARVGGEQDHDLWVTSPYQSTLSVAEGGGERPVFAGAKADVAGMVAAALALMSAVYQPHDAAYAAECLRTAESVYAYAEANPGLSDTDVFYHDDSHEDALMCGAVELYRVTGEPELLEAAIEYHESLGPHWWVVDWASQHDYCRHSLFVAGHEPALFLWELDAETYPGRVTDTEHIAGLAWFLDWGSLRYATGAAFSAALYYDVTGNPVYRDFALSQLDYVMGANEYDRSFVIGWGEDPPENPHHANAYGHDALDWDLSRPPLHNLAGALVGGPTKGAPDAVTQPGYGDDIGDWIGNEVTIDYNSGLVGLAAFAVHCGCFDDYVPGETHGPPEPPECEEGGGGVDPPAGPVDYLIEPPDPCRSAFWVEGCEEGDPASACGGVCAVANACSPPEDPSQADKEMTFMCPRFMMLAPEMLQAVRDDAATYGWADEEPFAYAVAGHDPDPVLDGGAPSTCCQCYQLVFETPEPGSPQPPDLPIPKPVIVQSFDTAAGGPKNFDLYMAAGGYGAFNACYDDPLFGNNTVFGHFMYDDYPGHMTPSGHGNVSFVDVEECRALYDVTLESLQSCVCQERIAELCSEATSVSEWTTSTTRWSCVGTNRFDSLYHQNWDVRVRKVECPEHLTRVTGCRLLNLEGLPAPDPSVRTVEDIPEGDATWLSDGYNTTTTQDCCKPSCAWRDWVEGMGLTPAGEWNAIYSCDESGAPLLASGPGPGCPPGFEGPDCEVNIDDCFEGACENGGICVDGIDRFTCRCPEGFRGDDCSEVCPPEGCGPPAGPVLVQVIEDSSWDGGFVAYIAMVNRGPAAVDGWELECKLDFAVQEAWNTVWTTRGDLDVFRDDDWNAAIEVGGEQTLGFVGAGALTPESVRGCSFNGVPAPVEVVLLP